MTDFDDRWTYAKMQEAIRDLPPPPDPVRLTRRQMDALPKAMPQPHGALGAGLLGVPVYRVDRIEDSTPYQLEHDGEPATVIERHDEIRRAAATALLGDEGTRLLQEDALLSLSFKQATGMLLAAEDAMCAHDVSPDVRTSVLSGILLSAGPGTHDATNLDEAAERVRARREAIERLTRTTVKIAPPFLMVNERPDFTAGLGLGGRL